MKPLIFSIIIPLLLAFPVSAKTCLYPLPDSIPPPPPGGPVILIGPSVACTWNECVYYSDVPVACECQWTINGVVQPVNTMPLTMVWDDAGLYYVSLTFICNGQSSVPDTVITEVSEGPPPPSPIQGPGESCESFAETYTTTVGPGETCSWWVDGLLQGTNLPVLQVTWAERGNHLIEARAVSDCGTGNPVFKTVSVLYTPEVFLGNDTTILQGQTLLLDAGNPGSEYLWSTGSTSQTILVSVSGTYSVVVSNLCGSGTDEIEVTVLVGIEESGEPENFSIGLLNGRFYLIHPPQNIRRIEIYDLAGKCIFITDRISNFQVPVNGFIMIRIITDHEIFARKVLIP